VWEECVPQKWNERQWNREVEGNGDESIHDVKLIKIHPQSWGNKTREGVRRGGEESFRSHQVEFLSHLSCIVSQFLRLSCSSRRSGLVFNSDENEIYQTQVPRSIV
jgi:hypothetical protein